MAQKRITARHRLRQERLSSLVRQARTQKAFADRHGLDHRHLSQMMQPLGSKNWRGVGDEIVEKLEADQTLRLYQGWFDAPEPAAAAPTEQLSAGHKASREKNDLLAIWYSLIGLANYMHRTRPEQGADVARDVVAVAGIDFSKQGFVNTLVGHLLGAESVSEAELQNLLQPPASSASRRTAQRVK